VCQQVIANAHHDCTAWVWRVAHIYDAPDARYQHTCTPVPKDDPYLTVVVEVNARKILGHYILDRGAMYSGGDVDGNYTRRWQRLLALATDVNRCFTVLQGFHFIASRFTPVKLRR